jgi:large subunit ribosomal protein L23
MKQERFLKMIRSPHLSEKATIAAEKRNEYVFEVGKSATKQQIKDAIEYLFKTKVKCVRVLNVKTKPKRFGKMEGKSKAWKKAYVTLLADQKIDFAGAQ